MLTNPRDAFRGQSSRNMVRFDGMGTVSYQCSIVTLSLEIFDFKNVMTLNSGSNVTYLCKFWDIYICTVWDGATSPAWSHMGDDFVSTGSCTIPITEGVVQCPQSFGTSCPHGMTRSNQNIAWWSR